MEMVVPPGAHKTARRRGAGMVCGAKRIRSFYLPWMTGVTTKLSTTTPPKGLTSPLHYQCRDHASA